MRQARLFIFAILLLVVTAALMQRGPSSPHPAEAGDVPVPTFMRLVGTLQFTIGPFQFGAWTGVPIEALIDGQVCGTTTTYGGSFLLNVKADDEVPGCGTDGDIVNFRVTVFGRQRIAPQTVTFITSSGGEIHLTVCPFLLLCRPNGP